MKKEYFKRKSRRVTAMTLALLMSVSIFPQALPKAWAAAPDAEAAESAPEQVVIVEIPAEQTEGEEQIPKPESLVEEAPVEEVKTEESETVEEENTEPTEEEPLETIETAAEGTVKEAPAEKAAENDLTAEELEALHDGNYDRFMGSAAKIPDAAELDVASFDNRRLLVADKAYEKLTDVQKALEDVAAAYANMEAVRALLEGTPEPEAPVMALSVGGTFYTKQDGTGASKTAGRNLLKFTVTSEAPATVSIAKAGSSYKPSGEFIIPSSVEYDGVTYSVTSFGDAAFNDCGLTSVTIPSSFTSISAQAFEGCSGLTSVTIPSSVASIGEMAFGFCSGLTSVTIPSSVTSIGEYAFDYCSGLTSVTIEGSQVSIAEDAFNAVGNVYVPVTLVIRSDISDAPTGTNPVGWKYGHFNVDFIRPVKIDSNIKNGKVTASPATVQDSATTRTVTLTVTPDSGYELDKLYYIAKSAPTDEISIVSSSFSMPKDDVTVYATFKAKPLEVGAYFFTDADGANPSSDSTDKVLKFTVTGVGDNKTVSVTKANIDNNISGAISIPEKVTGLDGNEYSVTSVELNAFKGCTKITSVAIPSSVKTIGHHAFNGCDALASVNIPDGVTSIETYTFGTCRALTSIIIPNSVETIADGAFSGCGQLTSVTIPSSVKTIGAVAFNTCKALTSVTIKGVPQSIADNAFASVDNATATTILVLPTEWGTTAPNTATDKNNCESNGYFEWKGGKFAFPNKKVIISDAENGTVTADKKCVLDERISDADRTVTVTVTPATDYELDMLTVTKKSGGTVSTSPVTGKDNEYTFIMPQDDVTVSATFKAKPLAKGDSFFTAQDGSNPSLSAGALMFTVTNATNKTVSIAKGTSDLSGTLSIPKTVTYNGIEYTVTSIKNEGFRLCDSITSVTIPDSITKIASNAFDSCDSITSVTIPNSVIDISNYAFFNCDSLETVTIPNSVTNIGDDAFSECGHLKTVTIPDSVTHIGVDAFRECRNLETVTISNSVKKIPGNTFADCENLTTVIIGKSVTDVGSNAFRKVGESRAATLILAPESKLDLTPDEDGMITLGKGRFILSYIIAIDSTIQNGTVTTDKTIAKKNETVTVTVTPATGYEPEKLTYKAGTSDPAEIKLKDGKYTFTMPADNVTVSATFKQPHTHEWTYTASDNVIKAYCTKDDCTEYKGEENALTLTLTAEDAEFTGSPYTGASVEDNITSIVEGTAPTIMYRGVAPTVYDDSPTAPTEVGTYEAYVTLGTDPDDATAAKQFNIRTPKADTTALEAAVDAAKAADQADYTADVWTQILGYVEKSEDYIGKDLPTSAQDEIDALTADLTDALDAKADFSALDDALTNAADYLGSESDYTASSWKDFTDALAEAQSVRSNPATQTAIDSAAKALTDATDALQLAADTTELEKALADAKAAKQADYPSTVWDEIADYVKEAEDSYIGKDLSAADYQDDIDDLTADLKKALADKLADYTAVNAAFDKIPANLSDYDPDSTTELLKAQDAVITGLHVDKQSEVDKFAEDIEKALALLRLKGDKNLISATAPAVLYMGDTAQKVTTETAADGGAVTYSVDGTAVSVGPDGSITVKEPGEATITVKAVANDKYAEGTKTINVTVKKRTQEVKASDLTIVDTDSGVTIDAIVSEVAVSGVPALLGKTAKPVFKSSDESIATVNEDGVITVNKPGKVTISMTLPGNDFYNEVTVPTEVTLTIDELAVIEGSGGKYRVGSKEGLTFRSNGVFANFVGVQVDGKDVDASNYTAWEGSTYVKFLTKYLDSLAIGKHKLTYVFKNGTCDAYFYIERLSGGNGDSPVTGDKSNVVLWTSLLVLSMTGLAAVVIDRKKRGYSTMK